MNKFSLKSIIIEQCVGVHSTSAHDRICTWTCEFMDKTPQIAEEYITRYDDRQSPRNKASKIQKLAFRCFLLTSAKAKKLQDGDRSIRLYTTISLQLRHFSKIATIVYQKDSRSFQQWVQKISETKYSPRLRGNRHTDTHTHTHGQIAITLRLRSG